MLPNHWGSCLAKMFIAPELRVVAKVIHPPVVKSRAYLVVAGTERPATTSNSVQARRPLLKDSTHFGAVRSLPRLGCRGQRYPLAVPLDDDLHGLSDLHRIQRVSVIVNVCDFLAGKFHNHVASF